MKPIKAKPALYTLFYERLKQISQQKGYNLVIHGSLDRDLDLIAIPWTDNPTNEITLIHEFDFYLHGENQFKKSVFDKKKEDYLFSILPGNRHSYVININRGSKDGEWNRFDDEEYYIDISIIQVNFK